MKAGFRWMLLPPPDFSAGFVAMIGQLASMAFTATSTLYKTAAGNSGVHVFRSLNKELRTFSSPRRKTVVKLVGRLLVNSFLYGSGWFLIMLSRRYRVGNFALSLA